MEFTYQTFPNKVYFGRAFTTSLELAGKGDTPVLRVFLIASARNKALVEYIQASPQFELVHHFSQIAQHVPVELVDEAAKQLKPDHTDLLLCLGGGSAIGLAKALALRSGLPVWAIPSTYAGSEMTNIYGISVDGKKTVSRHVRVLPQVVVYDPALTATLPLQIALQSAANALAHLVEGVYAVQNNPVSYHQSLVGIRLVLKGYEAVKASQALTPEANEAFLLGAYLGGKSLGEVPMALHHKAAHVLGGNFNLDHASVHTVLLPYVLSHQWGALTDAQRQDFREAFGEQYPPAVLQAYYQAFQLPATLAAIGLQESTVADASRQIAALSFENPASTSAPHLEAMLRRAYRGESLWEA